MRRFIILVTVMLLMTAMLVVSAGPALAAISSGGGTPLSTVVYESQAAISSLSVGWRNGTCWAFHPVP
jgi:hypothetical protein